MKSVGNPPAREAGPYDSLLAEMSLDEYYDRHVLPRSRCPGWGFGRWPSKAELRRHFQRTHFFARTYRNRLRLDQLHREIRDLQQVIDDKATVDLGQKQLEVHQQASSSSTSAPGCLRTKEESPEKKPLEEVPLEQEPLEEEPLKPKPLVLKIGDEVLYDEDYKLDPIWMPTEPGDELLE